MCSADAARTEARRVLEVCNVCGYCNGLCDLFEAARRAPRLAAGDIDHLANLCHACRSCLYACQYAPPHAFGVNVPRALAAARWQSYRAHAWPPRLAPWLLAHPLLGMWIMLALCILLVLGLMLAHAGPGALFRAHPGAGAFYALLPWGQMTLLASLALGAALLALALGLVRFWRASGAIALNRRLLWRALRDALGLRNLRGGGPGCADHGPAHSHWRRRWHQLLLLGLGLCLAATLAATLYHHALGQLAPYGFTSAPVLLGTAGGLCMTLALGGLLALRCRADAEPLDPLAQRGDMALLILLALVALSGLALLAARATAAMGVLLGLHLGSVLAFFLLLPLGKFVHAGFRLLALAREAAERQP